MSWLRKAPPAPEPPLRAVSCALCGYTFSGPAAHSVAHDGGRCIAPHIWEGHLVQIAGVWCLRGATY